MPKKFFIATFGCRTNQADSSMVRSAFVQEDYHETLVPSDADVIVINSCTVTHRSDQQVRQLARHLKRERPEAKIIVTGCYAQRDPQTLAGVAAVDAVVDNARKHELVQIAGSLVKRPQQAVPSAKELAAIYTDSFRKVRAMPAFPSLQPADRTRPFVKIQDGCDAKCSYCIIPSSRGPGRSLPPEMVLRQIRELVGNGYKEIVLTGIHMGTYGMHLQPHYSLECLIEEILEIPGLRRVRLSSIEPMELSRKIIKIAASSDLLAPHFHICLQSGSNRILRRMLRPYSVKRFAEIVEEIRSCIPDAGIGTDVIAGYPGETEEDHGATLEFAERMPFTYLHVFPYSDRPGTPACLDPHKVPAGILRRRSRELRALSSRKNLEFRRQFLSRKLSVLTLSEEVEGKRECISGNYLKVLVDREIPANELLLVQATGSRGEYLIGEMEASTLQDHDGHRVTLGVGQREQHTGRTAI
ncbi:MAG: tRNA (N(6)-L-threonylcarbamoyladenosine(37)-C(2))-methylthiotransferase MtaB [Acidobacteria bacterium]|nr:tRNA (N(6)-L-threonylcarbamoyladenosine(37)-C(2))-methylthiotransferase MtaB [Acidobacteriota bacterium]